MLLHLPDVFLHDCLRNSLAVKRIGVMAVDALEQEPLSVDRDRLPVLCGDAVAAVNLCGSEADLTETELGRDSFNGIAAAVLQCQHERVEIRMLCRPKGG